MLHAAVKPLEDSDNMKNSFLLYWTRVFTIVELEARKLRQDPTELLMRGVQPALWLLIFGQAFSRIRGIPTDGISYMAFLTPGILAQSITFISIFFGIAIIWEKDMGLLQKVLTTPIRISSLVLGKMFSASLRSISQLIVIILLALLLGVRLHWGIGNILGVCFSVIVGASFFSGLSMVLASLMRTRERMMGIGQLITMPLFFSSNALYPLSIMPAWLKVVAMMNPMSYLVDSLRILLVGTVSSQLLLDWGVLIGACGLILFLNTRLFKRITN
ncbi:ABC transporter permease [Effusibacillus dendaii]|uniref:Transport permease protein n=1 Tax=Effusibacillus dendaii TaxID=2743772 RepID=A0A7I8DC25_9BACL|nr:ABC transporter permease [Effusibacillus dendaii]BCJ87557.1 transport permease protein [Effusibacillus dendaii]